MHDILYPFEFVDVHAKMNVTPFNGIIFVYILKRAFFFVIEVDVHLNRLRRPC